MSVTLLTITYSPQDKEYVKASDLSSLATKINSNLGLLNAALVSLTANNTFSGNNTFTGNLTTGAKRIKSVTTRNGAGAIPISHEIVQLVTTGTNALTLADGSTGQELTITMITDGGTGTVTPSNFGNGSTIAFADVGDSITLQFLNSNWWIKSNNGCTIA